jgi:drug/metabolite transporter, DME family
MAELWNNSTQTMSGVGARTQILFAAVLFGTTGTAQALGPDLDPLAVGASRIAIGGALLAVVALVAAGAGRLRLRTGHGPRAVLLAGACVAVYQATFFAAVADTGVAVGTVVAIGSGPAFAGLFASTFAGERLTSRWAAATGLACAGVVLLVLGGGGGSVSAPGVGLALLSGAGYAGYAVASKRMLDAGGAPEAVMAAVFGVGALLMLPLLAIVPAGGLTAPGGLALVLYLGAVPTALAYVLFARGLERTGASETATLTLAEPLTAAALGVIALGERPGLAAAAGAALVLSGLAVLALRPAKRVAGTGVAGEAARPVGAPRLPAAEARA